MFGLEPQKSRFEARDRHTEAEHRLGISLGCQLVGTCGLVLEFGFKGEWRCAANDDVGPEDRLGLWGSAGW